MDKEIVTAMILLNIVISSLLYVTVVMVGYEPFGHWVGYELAQIIGAMQVGLYWIVSKQKGN